MKKYISITFSIIFCLLITITTHAEFYSMSSESWENLPEELLTNDNAQIFFGEYKYLDPHYCDMDVVTVSQKQNIKGVFKKNKKITQYAIFFNRPHNNRPHEQFEIGKIYLCAYIDDTMPLFMWEAGDTNTEILKITATDEVSKKMEELLNSGAFDAAETERIARNNTSEQLIPSINWWVLGGICIILIIAVVLTLILIHKKKQ